MKTSHIITAAFGIAFLLYIIAFKIYRMHKHPISKSIIKELRFAIAERLIFWALEIIPNGPQKKSLAKFIINYVEGNHGIDSNGTFPLSNEVFEKAKTNGIPDFAKATKEFESSFKHMAVPGIKISDEAFAKSIEKEKEYFIKQKNQQSFGTVIPCDKCGGIVFVKRANENKIS